jgi:hypothetical protein
MLNMASWMPTILLIAFLQHSTGYIPSFPIGPRTEAPILCRLSQKSPHRSTAHTTTLLQRIRAQTCIDSTPNNDAPMTMPRTKRRRWVGGSEVLEESCTTVSRHKLNDNDAKDYPGDSLFSRIARVVCSCSLVPRKEVQHRILVYLSDFLMHAFHHRSVKLSQGTCTNHVDFFTAHRQPCSNFSFRVAGTFTSSNTHIFLLSGLDLI